MSRLYVYFHVTQSCSICSAFEYFSGVVMTNRTLRTNELFQVRLDLVIPKWAGSIEIGVTQHTATGLKLPFKMSTGKWVLFRPFFSDCVCRKAIATVASPGVLDGRRSTAKIPRARWRMGVQFSPHKGHSACPGYGTLRGDTELWINNGLILIFTLSATKPLLISIQTGRSVEDMLLKQSEMFFRKSTWIMSGEDVLRDAKIIIPQYVRDLSRLVVSTLVVM